VADDDRTRPDRSTPGPTTDAGPRRRPSAVLLPGGLIAIGISALTLVGPTHWDGHIPGSHLAWAAVAVAAVVGLVLLVPPRRG
jgi:hypothetical protein